MDFMGMIISFLALMFVVCGVIIFVIHRTLIHSTDGAVKRLNDEVANYNAKQAELAKKLKEADEELAKRQAEARDLANKMRSEAEEASKAEREKIVGNARKEGEEIIAKAQNARDKLRIELEKEMDVKAINFGMEILNKILSEKAKGAFDQVLTAEFLENLKTVDMSRIAPDVTTLEVVSLGVIDPQIKNEVGKIIKEKLKRDLTITASADPQMGGGIILKFGSLALDGSLKNLIREAALSQKQTVEARK